MPEGSKNSSICGGLQFKKVLRFPEVAASVYIHLSKVKPVYHSQLKVVAGVDLKEGKAVSRSSPGPITPLLRG